MTGLFNAPAASRLPLSAPTPVNIPATFGAKLALYWFGTWCAAAAVNRADEICGLFCAANCSALASDKCMGPWGGVWAHNTAAQSSIPKQSRERKGAVHCAPGFV